MNVTPTKTRVSLDSIITRLQFILFSDIFTQKAKKTPTNFTRKRKMPLAHMVVFMLNLVKQTTNTSLNRLFDILRQAPAPTSAPTQTPTLTPDQVEPVTVQAFSKDRQNLRPEAIHYLIDEVNKEIYSGAFKTWHGFRFLAIDGTKIQLPSSPKLRELFGTIGRNDKAPTAQASALYDVLNGIILDAEIGPMSNGERAMAMAHLDRLSDKFSNGVTNLVLFDCGYASFELIQHCIANGITFVMRLKTKFNNDIDKMPYGCHNYFLNRGNESLKIRVIKFPLSEDQDETLITNLFDYSLGEEAFKKLYFKRWPIEVKYNDLKHKLEIENFSSRTEVGIYQDFYVTILLNNIITVATWETQDIVDEDDKGKEL
jgi:hypothetical protein